MSQAILELSTLEPDRPFLTIDGAVYYMSVREDFGLEEAARLARLQQKVVQIRNTDDDLPSPEDIQMALHALDEAVSMLVRNCPPEVLAKLREPQRLDIMAAFSKAALLEKERKALRESLLIGESTSPDSNGSMVAVSRSGGA